MPQHWKRPGETPRWSAQAEAALVAHTWPGIVRELEHLVRRACALATGPELGVEVLPPELAGSATGAAGRPRFRALDNAGLKAAKKAAQLELERAFAEEPLAQHAGNVSRAAQAAGMQCGNLQKLLARLRSVERRLV
jgi:DNA-binding NtrC family response regulator